MSKKAIAALVLGLILLACPAAWAAAPPTWTAKVLDTHDGDTPVVMTKVRVWRVDCPELAQPWGPEAEAFAREILVGRQVHLQVMGASYGRPVCRVRIDGVGDLAEALVSAGLAWAEPRYLGQDDYSQRLRDLEAQARRERRGLWADPNPVAPWDWRKARKAGK